MSYGKYYESTYLYSTSFTHKTPLALFSLCLYTFTCHTHHNRSVSPSYHQPNALVFIVIISSLFLWGTPAPIVDVIN